jgi:hypothetical protein
LIWKFHASGSGEIGAHFTDHCELSQLSSSFLFNFMLLLFQNLCSGMVLRVPNA